MEKYEWPQEGCVEQMILGIYERNIKESDKASR